ncbi:MAG: vWA domain-containing protein [Thermoleophilaceae bacterium]
MRAVCALTAAMLAGGTWPVALTAAATAPDPEPTGTEAEPVPPPVEEKPPPPPVEDKPPPPPVEEKPPPPPPVEEDPPPPVEEDRAPQQLSLQSFETTATTPTDTTPTPPPPTEEETPDKPLVVTIDEPVDGEAIEAGEQTVTVSGEVSLGPLDVGVASLFVIDVSRSTITAAPDCEDQNHDGTRRALDCQIAAALELHGNFVREGIEVGVVSFGSGEGEGEPEVKDLDEPTAGIQDFTGSAADNNRNDVPDVEDALRGLHGEGFFDEGPAFLAAVVDASFGDALDEVTATFDGRPPGQPRVAFFFSDGSDSTDNYDDALEDARQAGIRIFTFYFGEATEGGCGEGPLQDIADATGGTCTPVADPATLSDFNVLGVDEVLVSLNGGDPVPAPLDPVGTFFGAFSTPLSGSFLPGENTISAIAGAAEGSAAQTTVMLTAAAASQPPPSGTTPPPPGTAPPPPPQTPPSDPPESPADPDPLDEDGETGDGDNPPDGPGGSSFFGASFPGAGLPPAAGDPTAGGLEPVLGETAVIGLVSGTVFVRFPSGELVKLTGPVEIPLGSTIDTRRGEVRITTVKDRTGALQTGDFHDGIFVLTQELGTPPVTELRLKSDDLDEPAMLPATHRGDEEHECRDEDQRLWGETDGDANFRTRGNYSASTVRGTEWLTRDCRNGTITRVREGQVRVFDLVRRLTVILTQGESYLAESEGAEDSGSAAREPHAPRS